MTPAERWKFLTEAEFTMRKRFEWQSHNGPHPEPHEMQNWTPAAGISPSKEQLQKWWGAVKDVWLEYSRQIAEGLSPMPPPADLARVMGGLSGYLAVGKMPPQISDAIAEGRTPPAPKESRDIGLAVAYHKAAKSGIIHNGATIRIADLTPTKTISENYKVAANTVRSWVSKYEPAFLGVNSITPEILDSLMRKAGKTYRNSGRSHAAIRRRSQAAT